MSRMVEVVIDSVRVSLTNQQRIVVLREVNNERYLPIWIGPYEAEAITIALQEIEVARPQTHDLLKSILTTLNAGLLRIEVVSLKEDVFYGNLVVEVDGRTVYIDFAPIGCAGTGGPGARADPCFKGSNGFGRCDPRGRFAEPKACCSIYPGPAGLWRRTRNRNFFRTPFCF